MKKIKTAKQIEKHIKGVANHRRIEILLLIMSTKGLTVENISEILNCNFKTVSEHTRRLAQAGLVDKNYVGNSVVHSLSPYGKIFSEFINSFRNS